MRYARIIVLLAFLFCALNPALLRGREAAAAEAIQEKTITLDVKDLDIVDVLRMIADQSGLNIIASKNVKGAVTINLQSVPVEKALDAILKVNNCGYVKEDNIIQVYTYPELSQKLQFSQLVTKVFRLENVKATDLKQTLLSLKSDRGKLEVEPKTNSIVVTDTEENVHSVEEAIRQMDKKQETKLFKLNYAKPLDLQKNLLGIIPAAEGDVLVDERTNSLMVTASPLLLNKIGVLVSSWDTAIPQVLIEAKIMQVTLDKSRLLGIDWQYQDNSAHHPVTVGVHGLPTPTGATFIEALKFGVLSQTDFEVAINTLETFNDTNLLSSPRIVTLDNQEAKILIGSSEPYEVFHFDQNGVINGKEIRFVEVGIKLTVTPKITEDGFITMKIHPEVSTPRLGTAVADIAIDTTEADTVMTVKDGNTVVLGGLIKDDKEKDVAKIPFLGDIPVLKHLFSTTYTKHTKKEIIIFITPRIVNAGSAFSFPDKREEEMLKAIEKERKHRKR